MIAKQHPRYLELCKSKIYYYSQTKTIAVLKGKYYIEHGEPTIGTVKEVSTLKDRLITITISLRPIDVLKTIQSVEALPESTKNITKRFIPTMTIRNVKHMIQKLFKISAAQQQLYLLQKQEDEVRVMDISDDLRDLKFYGISENDEIVVVVE
jgi:hypothetical protein